MHTVKGFSVVNEAEVDVFLEFLCFFYDPMDVGNLISGSSAFSKSSLYIWKFSVLVLLTPSLEDFEHDLAGMKLKDTCSLEESDDKPRQHNKKQRHHFANKGPYSQSYGFSSSHVWM